MVTRHGSSGALSQSRCHFSGDLADEELARSHVGQECPRQRCVPKPEYAEEERAGEELRRVGGQGQMRDL